MGRDVIHIGQRKTATTWLQAAFSAAAEEGLISFANPNFNAWFRGAREQDPLDRDFSEMVAILQAQPGSPRVLSRETLIMMRPAAATIDALKAGWPDAQILVTTRGPADYLRSAYAQGLKNGSRNTASNFARAYPRNHMAISHDLNRVHAEYAARFGAENVHFYPYEEIRRAPAAFLAFVDQLVGAPVSRHAPETRRNASPPPVIQELARHISVQLHESAPDFLETGKWQAFLHFAFPAIALTDGGLTQINRVASKERIALDTSTPELDEDMKAAFGAMATVIDRYPVYADHRDAYLLP